MLPKSKYASGKEHCMSPNIIAMRRLHSWQFFFILPILEECLSVMSVKQSLKTLKTEKGKKKKSIYMWHVHAATIQLCFSQVSIFTLFQFIPVLSLRIAVFTKHEKICQIKKLKWVLTLPQSQQVKSYFSLHIFQ